MNDHKNLVAAGWTPFPTRAGETSYSKGTLTLYLVDAGEGTGRTMWRLAMGAHRMDSKPKESLQTFLDRAMLHHAKMATAHFNASGDLFAQWEDPHGS